MRILIAIPVHNEQKYVSGVLKRVRAQGLDIVVIDDGSTDGTADILANEPGIQVIRHPVNKGYGQSIIDAFSYAYDKKYDWVITMDCDDQHEPESIPLFVDQIKTNRYDIISGSRYTDLSKADDIAPGDRRAINATITATLNDLFNWKITDAFCGYKAHRVCAMHDLHLDETGYAFPLQLWPRAQKAGLRIKEIPVKRIYVDPTRTFGGNLDDAHKRLNHYLSVLKHEVSLAAPPKQTVQACAGCCCH